MLWRGVFEPPFSFRLAEKKTAVHGQKKRALSRPYDLSVIWRQYGSYWLEMRRKSASLLPGALYHTIEVVHRRRQSCAANFRWAMFTPCSSFRAFTVSACGPPSISVTSEKYFTGSSFRSARRCLSFTEHRMSGSGKRSISIRQAPRAWPAPPDAGTHSRTEQVRRNRQKGSRIPEAPIRGRPRIPRNGLSHCGTAPFFWTVHGPFSLAQPKKMGGANSRPLYKGSNQTSSRQRGMLIHLGPPRPRDSSAQGMVWMRMPSSSSRRLVTWLRE